MRDNECPKDLQEVERGCVLVKKDEKSVIELTKIAYGRESEEGREHILFERRYRI